MQDLRIYEEDEEDCNLVKMNTEEFEISGIAAVAEALYNQ
jgi:hypothetical protein